MATPFHSTTDGVGEEQKATAVVTAVTGSQQKPFLALCKTLSSPTRPSTATSLCLQETNAMFLKTITRNKGARLRDTSNLTGDDVDLNIHANSKNIRRTTRLNTYCSTHERTSYLSPYEIPTYGLTDMSTYDVRTNRRMGARRTPTNKKTVPPQTVPSKPTTSFFKRTDPPPSSFPRGRRRRTTDGQTYRRVDKPTDGRTDDECQQFKNHSHRTPYPPNPDQAQKNAHIRLFHRSHAAAADRRTDGWTSRLTEGR